ncbi:hypothetical protein ACF3NT_04755 [Naumannella halotolerans]|uniref:hypothetical protein n=1 Tax=Naumannella halotolerans TaxID=993414 RepID=UPI00370D12A3
MIGSEDRLAAYGAGFSGPRGYLDFARYGPPSEAVLAATAEVMDQAAHGEPTELLEEWTTAALAAVARLSGFGVAQHAFVPNTSSGIFGLASGLPGAVVLLSPGEFPANLHPWWRAAEAGLIEVVTLTDPHHPRPVTPELVASRLAAAEHRVTAVVVSAVDYRTGFRADLAGIREAIGDRLLLVDGLLSDLQAAGLEVVSPVDPVDRAGIVVVRAADAPVRHHRALAAVLRTTLHAPDRIRISVHADTEASVLGELVDRIG